VRKRIERRMCLLAALVVCAGIGLAIRADDRLDAARAGASSMADAVEVALEGLPPLCAPGEMLPLNWSVTGGWQVDRTAVFWDTRTHAYDLAYTYRTVFQERKPMGHFYDYVDVLQGAETLYLRPYAVVDGEIVWSSREYTVPTVRGMTLGSASAYTDGAGQWWDADAEFQHHWLGVSGGQVRTVPGAISGTEDDAIYQTQRVGVTGFSCWFSTGAASMQVQVEFHLAEISALGVGERVFDIILEPGTANEVSIRDVDVAALAGSYAKLVLTQTVTVTDDQLDVEFVGKTTEAPILSGILLRGVSAVPERQTTQRIGFVDDDTYVQSTANNRRSEAILLGGSGQYHGGLRFVYMQLPQGSTINHAEIRVTAAEDSYQAMRLAIHGEAIDDSPDFREGPLVQDRARTTSSVAWQLAGSDAWIAGREYASPELKDVVQEIVSRSGWRERNSMTILLIAGDSDAAPRRVWAKDGSDHDRAWLIIDYTPPGSEPPTPAPVLTITPIPSWTPTATITTTSTQTQTPTVTRTPTETVMPSPTPTDKPPFVKSYLPLLFRPFMKP